MAINVRVRPGVMAWQIGVALLGWWITGSAWALLIVALAALSIDPKP